ncbi:hypothetical protein KVR01_005887 [Diaporthe batatas]|uniref:uncharacterized protein n=1 Tax=Diaporthe batatas TaxID=748121 RepID=UPI001D0400EF|nr:uncharacterized protein KVR01_005887 [Diaporthe batatas]KAG8163969.1 hypothetical protein KVR01_005887 [Diaporthe batatas]
MHGYTSLAVCTLAVNWTLALLALLALLAVVAICWVGFELPPRRPGLDDILVVAAFLVGLVLVALSTWALVDEGLGRHQRDVAAPRVEAAAKSVLVSEALWTLTTALLRIAAGLFTRRVFRPAAPLARRLTVAVMVLSAALAAASVVQVFAICRPLAAQWDPRVRGACGDQAVSFLVLEALGLLLDIGVLAVPCVVIVKLRLPVGTRVASALIANIGAV